MGGGGAPSNTAGDVAMYRPTHAHELQPIGAVENGGAPLWIAAERPTGHGSSTSQHASPGALGACASVGGYSGADDDVHRALSGQRHALSPRPAGASIACPRGGSSSPAIYRSHISRTSPARRRSHGGESTADLLYMDSCAPDAKPPDDLHRTTPRTPWLGVYSAPHRATFSGRSARALLRGADGDNGGGGDDERGIACASRAQTRVSMCVSADGSTSRDTHAWAGVGGHTMARFVALAILEHPPSPPVRAGPIHVMGRAVHSRVHTLSGQPRVRHCPDCAVDGSRVPCACARTREQPNARENNSLSCDDHGDMRRGLGCAQCRRGGAALGTP